MGTSWKAVVEVPVGVQSSRLAEIIQADLDAVDLAMSTWKAESDLSRFNRAEAGEVVGVSELTLDVVRLCGPWVEVTGRAFDPTVGPLVRLWGFGSYEDVEAPSKDGLTAALGSVDFGAIEVRDGGLVKARDGVELDVSAVAKGHAVDLAAASLLEAGCTSFLLEVGGEMVLRGRNAQGQPWRIGIDDPLPPEGADPVSVLNLAPRPPFARLALGDRAVATSGDYRNVREVNGKIVAHAIDPRSGQPIDHDLASVTVVAATCAEADAFATAALVLGPKEGLRLLEERSNVEGYLLVRVRRDGKTVLDVRQTTGMAKLIMPPPPATPVERAR